MPVASSRSSSLYALYKAASVFPCPINASMMYVPGASMASTSVCWASHGSNPKTSSNESPFRIAGRTNPAYVIAFRANGSNELSSNLRRLLKTVPDPIQSATVTSPVMAVRWCRLSMEGRSTCRYSRSLSNSSRRTSFHAAPPITSSSTIFALTAMNP